MSGRSPYRKHDADVAFLERVRAASHGELARLVLEYARADEWKRVAIHRAQLRAPHGAPARAKDPYRR